MKPKGFTIIEILCVIVLLTILSTVLMPVFANSRLESKSKNAKQNLVNLWRGLKLYQADNEEKVEFGLPQDMGLPSDPKTMASFVKSFMKDYHPSWTSKASIMPCGSKVGDDDGGGLGYMPMVRTVWLPEVTKRRESTVLLYDKNCNVPGTRVMCQFCNKRSIGITLIGQIRDRISSDWMVYDQAFYQ